MDNGAGLLAEQFQHVTLHRYDNTLVVTEVHERIRAGVGQCIEEYFVAYRELRLPADAGLVEAW